MLVLTCVISQASSHQYTVNLSLKNSRDELTVCRVESTHRAYPGRSVPGQGRIQKYGLGGVKGCVSSSPLPLAPPPLAVPSLPFPTPFPLPLEVGPFNPAKIEFGTF